MRGEAKQPPKKHKWLKELLEHKHTPKSKTSPHAYKRNIMENIEITFNTILELFGALAVIGGGIKILVSLLNPYKEVTAKLKKHDELLTKDKEKMQEMDDALERIENEQKVQGKAIMALINHIITGNDKDKLKKTYQDMVNHYIEL